MGGRNRKTQFDRARDELCSHVIRCEVLEADMDARLEWMDETMEYMAGRYPDLSELELAQLEVVGRRFIQPAIPHGAHAHARNRGNWEDAREESEHEEPAAAGV